MTPPPSPPPSPPRSPGWMKLLLAVSLALNLGVAGVLGGLALRHAADAPPPDLQRGAAPQGLSLRHAVAALPDAERRALRQSWRADMQTARQEAPPAPPVADVLALLRADDLDQTALRAALEAPQARAVAAGRVGAALLVAQLAEMDPAARAAYADRLEERLTEGRSRWRGRPGGG